MQLTTTSNYKFVHLNSSHPVLIQEALRDGLKDKGDLMGGRRSWFERLAVGPHFTIPGVVTKCEETKKKLKKRAHGNNIHVGTTS